MDLQITLAKANADTKTLKEPVKYYFAEANTKTFREPGKYYLADQFQKIVFEGFPYHSFKF